MRCIFILGFLMGSVIKPSSDNSTVVYHLYALYQYVQALQEQLPQERWWHDQVNALADDLTQRIGEDASERIMGHIRKHLEDFHTRGVDQYITDWFKETVFPAVCNRIRYHAEDLQKLESNALKTSFSTLFEHLELIILLELNSDEEKFGLSDARRQKVDKILSCIVLGWKFPPSVRQEMQNVQRELLNKTRPLTTRPGDLVAFGTGKAGSEVEKQYQSVLEKRYTEMRQESQELRSLRKKLRQQRSKLNEIQENLNDKQSELSQLRQQLQKQENGAEQSQAAPQLFREATKIGKRMTPEEIAGKIKEVQDKIQDLKDKEKEVRKEIERLQQEIDRYTSEVTKQPSQELQNAEQELDRLLRKLRDKTSLMSVTWKHPDELFFEGETESWPAYKAYYLNQVISVNTCFRERYIDRDPASQVQNVQDELSQLRGDKLKAPEQRVVTQEQATKQPEQLEPKQPEDGQPKPAAKVRLLSEEESKEQQEAFYAYLAKIRRAREEDDSDDEDDSDNEDDDE